MAAYVLSEVVARDPAAFREYARLAERAIAAFGGRYLVRGATAEVAEGEPTSRKFVLVEFPDMQRLREWYASPAYAEALAFRKDALGRRLIFLEG